MTESLLSLVICTYNRCELLRVALSSVCEQTLPKEHYEVIVVDNNSTDDTKSVVNEFLSHGNVRYLLETKQGLSNARNAGWQASRGSFVVYMDDDSKAPVNWLKVATRIAKEGRYDVFGGPIYPFYNTEKPAWYKESYDMRGFGVTDSQRVFTSSEYLSGGNIFISKDKLKAVNGFDTSFGMTGVKLAYCEETDLQIRLRKIYPNIKVLCDPQLYNFHLVRNEKLSLLWNVRDQFARGRDSHVYVENTFLQAPRWKLLIYGLETLCKVFIKTAISFAVRNREIYPCWQNYFREKSVKSFSKLGKIFTALKKTCL